MQSMSSLNPSGNCLSGLPMYTWHQWPAWTVYRPWGMKKIKQFLNDCPTLSWGCLSRMGQIVKQDRVVSLELMHAFLSLLEKEWVSATDNWVRNFIAGIGAYSAIAFCGLFWGLEVFLVDLFGLPKYLKKDLRVKDQYHLTPLVAETNSRIKAKLWIKRLLEVCLSEKWLHGPAFDDHSNGEINYVGYEREILERFQSIQSTWPDIISADVQALEEYGLSRSFWQGATLEARARGTNPKDIDLTICWRTFEGAKGQHPRLAMQDHYSDIRLLILVLLKFSENLWWDNNTEEGGVEGMNRIKWNSGFTFQLYSDFNAHWIIFKVDNKILLRFL